MIEYYPARLDATHFKLAKFGDEGGDQPENIYYISWNQAKDDMLCDCPNRRSGRHVNDKHGKWIRSWLALGEPVGFFDKEGVFHATPDDQPSFSEPSELDLDARGDDDEFPDDEAPPNGDLDGDDEGEHR